MASKKRVGSRLQDKSKDSESSINLSGKRNIAEVPVDLLELQRLLELERVRSHRLEEEMKSKEDRFKRKEGQYLRLLEEYEHEMHSRSDLALSPINEQSAKHLNNIKALHGQLMGMVTNIQGSTSRVLAVHERDIIRRFNSKLNDLKANLEKEKKQKIESVETNAEHEIRRAHELEMLRASIELVENQNKELQAQNRQLRLAARTQEGTNQQLVSKLVTTNKRMTSMQQETERMKASSALQTQSLESLPRLMTEKATRSEEVTENTNRYEVAIQHLKRMLHLERKNSQQLRAAYVQEVQSKTELEQIIRKCIDDIHSDLGAMQGVQSDLGKLEREALVEKLLSQEKILSLLHDMAFPKPLRSNNG